MPRGGEELLIPADCGKKLRRKFILSLDVIANRVDISESRHLETNFVRFGPQLPMAPGKGDVLPEQKLMKIPYRTMKRDNWLGGIGQVRTFTAGETDLPGLIRPIGEMTGNGRVGEIPASHIPYFRPRRQGRVL